MDGKSISRTFNIKMNFLPQFLFYLLIFYYIMILMYHLHL